MTTASGEFKTSGGRAPALETGTALILDRDRLERPVWLRFASPKRIIRTRRLEEIVSCLEEAERAVNRGLYAAGFVAYEAAPAFDGALVTRPPEAGPLLWFGLYDTVQEIPPPASSFPPAHAPGPGAAWTPDISRHAYRAAVERIRSYIAAGDTYQVNYTFRLERPAGTSDPAASFAWLLSGVTRQPGAFLAAVDTGDLVCLSASPELFFRLDGPRITCRPMKGTAPRGLRWTDDRAREEWLRHSAKNRAENVMIVDMTRNDLGRIARTGTVQVPSLFDVERYDTLLQMTSTVTALTDAPIPEIFRALFPCASVTGAPKVRTMQIIAELESSPRGVYTGCIGYLAPGRRARFNVAIRTVQVHRAGNRAVYGTGGGVVWDSTPESEYEECLTKALVVNAPTPSFCLLETMLWTPVGGYWLLDRHLDRLTESALYFGIPAEANDLRARLRSAEAVSAHEPRRVRLLLDERGDIRIETVVQPDLPPFPPGNEPPPGTAIRRVRLARRPIRSQDRFLYHKTTHRLVHDAALGEFPGAHDVILWNEAREITESCLANVVLKSGEAYVTPPVRCGLLAGTFRDHLLAAGLLREKVIRREDLERAETFYLINSVRGWMRGRLV